MGRDLNLISFSFLFSKNFDIIHIFGMFWVLHEIMPVSIDHNAWHIKSAQQSLTIVVIASDYSDQLYSTEEKLENVNSQGSCGDDYIDKILVNAS